MSLPSPYYQDEWVTIYHGDCREIIPKLPYVDLVLTDPPYGVGEEYEHYKDTRYNLKQLIETTMPLILNTAKRVLVTCGISNLYLYPEPDWILAWVIPAGVGRNPWGFTCWQPILAYGKDPYLANGLGSRPDIIIKTETSEDIGHPCSKPINFWKLLLIRGSPRPGEAILDPFLGSGTSAQATKVLNRKCIGIEIEEKYCEIAAKRCSQGVFNLNV